MSLFLVDLFLYDIYSHNCQYLRMFAYGQVTSVEDTPLVLSYKKSTAGGVVDLPTVKDGVYDFSVNWGDGSPIQRNVTYHRFEEPWDYEVVITGTFHGLSFHEKKGRERLTSIV